MSSIFFRTAIVFFLLTVAMKVMGKREIGELEVSELISALLLSEICSIPIDDPNIPMINAVIPVVFIVSLEIILSFLKNKSRLLKRIIDGNSSYLIKDGKLSREELINNRISIEEFFAALRQNGVGSISDIKHCILEANGKVSVIMRDTPTDTPVIIDGEINAKALAEIGIGESELKEALRGLSPHDVFLMTRSERGSYNIILKEEK